MPLFDFLVKRSNKKAKEATQPQRESIQSRSTTTRPNIQGTKSPLSRIADDSGRELVFSWLRSGVDTPNRNEWTILREKRRFLERHPELFDPKIEAVLREMKAKNAGDADRVGLFSRLQRILHQARVRGSTVEAIRSAYINIFGGLTLDVPQWLEHDMYQLTALDISDRVEHLRKCIYHAERDQTVATEVIADLYGLLGKATRADESASSRERLEEAVAAYGEALETYTHDCYPEHFAELQTNLGNVYANLSEEVSQQENLELAERCYREALRVFTLEDFPSEWANAQNNLDNALLMQGSRKREIAIKQLEDVLVNIGMDTFGDIWARKQINLGVCYLDRVIEDRAKNFERAIQCFEAALRYFTREEYPTEWADTQMNLGRAYLQRLEGDFASNIEKALRCFQSAERIPREKVTRRIIIAQLEGLGDTYRKRLRGDMAENIELAIQYLSAALQILERTSFRAKLLKVHNDLGEAYRKRVEGDRAENLLMARSLHRTVLMLSRSMHPVECQRAQLNLAYLETLL